jgi:hypothetical protein
MTNYMDATPDLYKVEKRHEKAKALGYNFHLIKINKPTNPVIAINWLNQALFHYLENNPLRLFRHKLTLLIMNN